MIIDPQKTDKVQNYKFLIGAVLPRPIVFVTSLNSEGVVNAAPFSFFSVVCIDPPMLSITCSKKKNGEYKDTFNNIKSANEFVVQTVTKDNVAKVNDTAIEFPPNKSEIEQVGFNLLPSKKIKVPRIKECPIHMECKLNRILELGDCDLIIGEIVQMHIEDYLYKEGRINTELLSPVGRLAGTDYVKLGEIFSMSRIKYEDWNPSKD